MHGKHLWRTEVFGNHDDAIDGQTGLLGEHILRSDSSGNISGYSVKSGSTLWKIAMGDKLQEMCGLDAGHIALGLKNKQWKSVQLSDGSMTKLEGRPADCIRLDTHKKLGQANHLFRDVGASDVRIDGMDVITALSLLGDEGHSLLIGSKTPGTSVPMLAMAHSDAPKTDANDGARSKSSKDKSGSRLSTDWASEVPAIDPLRVREGAPTFVTMNENFIAVVYQPNEGSPHVVCFSREGGRRLWDSALPDKASSLEAINISKSRVYVSEYGRLDAFDIADGKLAFMIGE